MANELDDVLADFDPKSGQKPKPQQATQQTVAVKEAQVADKKRDEVHEYVPSCGVDIGTANLCLTRKLKDGTFVNKHIRNMLYELDVSDEANEMLEKSSYLYIKSDSKYYVVGDDALKLSLAIGGKDKVIRPMKNGVINPSLKDGQELLFFIISALLGKPIIANESLRFSCPGQDLDSSVDNRFHSMILMSFFKKLGFNPKPVNEACCVLYDSGSIMKTEDGDIPLSGIAMSWGAGQVNTVLAYKGLSLMEFSSVKSGDNIDEMVEKTTGANKSKIIKEKETKLDLANADISNPVQSALSIYYDETIERIIHNMGNKFREKASEMDGEIEIVVAGGTSMPKNFCNRFEQIIKESNFPFRVYRVRHAVNPFHAVSQGACIRALADFEKSLKN